jgi:hypothetical protein
MQLTPRKGDGRSRFELETFSAWARRGSDARQFSESDGVEAVVAAPKPTAGPGSEALLAGYWHSLQADCLDMARCSPKLAGSATPHEAGRRMFRALTKPSMKKIFRGLSLLLFLLAVGAIVVLLTSDGFHALRLTSLHQQSSAMALILIGTSYISLQLSSKRRWSEKLKAIFLGLAFALWGSEQFLPASRLVTLMDSAVITIFVVDLGLIILDSLKRNDRQAP